MSDVPAGWRATTLGEVGDYHNGRGFKKSEWRTSGGRPIIRIQNLTGSSNVFNHYDGETDERYTARRGDLLVSWAATLGAYLWDGPEAVVNQHIFKVRSRLDTRFHKYLLDHHLNALGRETHGSGMVHVTRGRFDALPIVVPDTQQEQRRIVAVLEDHLSRLDAADAYLATADQRLKAFQRAAVDDVMITKATRHDWPLVPLSQFAADVPRAMTDGPFGSSLARQHYTASGPRVIRLQNIGDGFYKEADAFISDEHFATLAKHEARGGDVVLASLGDQLPRAAVVPEGLGPAIVKADCIRLRVATTHHAQWVVRATQSSRSKSWARARLHGVGRQRLGMAGLRDVPVPRPPDDASIHMGLESISRAEEIAQRLVREAVDARHRTSTLRRALLTAAFTGRLTGRSSDIDLAEELADERVTA